ncbi:MAG: hypothetical protein QOK36_626, partial [Gaiellales bacterium]|nr:hypothetical protein [Gaiellales bacterium]
ALAPPPVAAEWCLPLVRPGGGVVLWVGPSADPARVARVAERLAAELCLPLCRCGGRVVLWSREQATDELTFAAGALGGAVLPPEASGVLVIGKLAATPARFPRRPGMAAKRPLRAAGSDRPPR